MNRERFMELNGKKIVFLGDSITYGYGLANHKDVYWRVLGRNTGAVTKGYGINGTRIAKQKVSVGAAYDAYFRTRVRKMDPDADIVMIFGGTNDFGHGDAPLGTMDDRTDDTFYGAVHSLCNELKQAYPEAEIIFMTPLRRSDEDAEYNDFGRPVIAPLTAYIMAVRRVCRAHEIPVLDLYDRLPDIVGYTIDGLHPDETGHRLIAQCIQAFLEEIQEGRMI